MSHPQLSFTLDDFYHVLTDEFPTLLETSSRAFFSIHPYDTALVHRVRKLPLDLGKYIASVDTDEKFFHIEFHPKFGWAELWTAFAWRESLSFQLKRRAETANDLDPTAKLSERIAHLEYKITRYLIRTFDVKSVHAAGTAAALVRTTLTATDLSAVLKLPDDLDRELSQIKQEMETLACPLKSQHAP